MMTVYNVSKAALDNLSEARRYELASQGIAVRVIEPGFVPTTGFVQKVNEAAAGREIPKEYAVYVNQRLTSFGAAADVPLATANDVAQTSWRLPPTARAGCGTSSAETRLSASACGARYRRPSTTSGAGRGLAAVRSRCGRCVRRGVTGRSDDEYAGKCTAVRCRRRGAGIHNRRHARDLESATI